MRNRPAVFLSLFFHYRSYYFSIDPLGPFVEASRRGQCETKRRPWFHALTVENKSYRRVGIVTALSLIKLVRPSKSTSSTAIFISPMHCMHTRYVNLASEKKKKKNRWDNERGQNAQLRNSFEPARNAEVRLSRNVIKSDSRQLDRSSDNCRPIIINA